MKSEFNTIDIVITWVDGNDPAWLNERNKYVFLDELKDKSTAGTERFEDTNLLQYVFRGIEKYMPWVRKIHFVTWGHLPKWLNTNNPKIHIVNHKDFIPKEFLPTFNSATINLNLHRIPDLADKFIYFNDDMFVLKPTDSTLFFKKGLPRDMAVQDIIEAYSIFDNYNYTVVNDLSLLNHLVSKNNFIRKNRFKYYSFRYGFKSNVKNLLLSRFSLFTGFIEPHTPAAYMKKTFEDVWKIFPNELSDSCKSKIRCQHTITENVVRYYQMAQGMFVPINREKFGTYSIMKQKNLPEFIRKQHKNLLCINYSDKDNFKKVKDALDSLMLDKSSFEI